MRRIGHKLPLRRLRFLQAVGELVKLGGKCRILVVAAHLDFVAVFALADQAHGKQNLSHALRADHGKNRRAQNHAAQQNPRPAQNIPLEIFNNFALFGVKVHHVYAADRVCARHDRHRGVALQRARMIGTVKHIVSAQCLRNRLQKRVFPDRILVDGRVIQHLSFSVGDQKPADVDIAQDGNDLVDGLRAERVRRLKGRGDDLNLVLHGGILRLKHQLSCVARRVNIQKHQRQRRNDHVCQRVSQLGAVGKQPQTAFRT